MTTVTLRQQKLSPLTNQEIDDNFSNLNTNKLESVVYPNLTTSGSGWYRVATTNTDGRGTYDLEVYTTGGNHDPSVLKIVAQCNWTGGRVLYAIWDGVFPASSVRVTRSASNSYLEIYFTTSVNTFAVRVNHTGFASGIVGYSGALSSGGDTVAETLALSSRLNISPGYIAGIDSNTVTNALGYTPYRAVTVEGAATAPANGLDAALQGWTAFDGYGTAVPNYPNNQWWVGAWTGGNSTRGVQLAGGYADSELYFRKGQDGWQSWKRIWHAGNLTNLNQLTNGPGYITGYTETDTLATVTARGTSTSTSVQLTSAGNHYNGHFYYDAYAADGSHYPHFLDGSNASGSKVNWRLFTGGTNSHTHYWGTDTALFATKLESTSRVDAPIFYDRDNNAYYIDPGSTSNLWALKLNRNTDHQLQVARIRGLNTDRTGDYIHMYERVHIGYPSGWGGVDAPTYGLSVWGNITAAQSSYEASWGYPQISTNSGWGSGAHPTIGSTGGSTGSLIMLHNPHIPFRTDNARSGASGRSGMRLAIDTAGSSWWDVGLTGDAFEIYRAASSTQQFWMDSSGHTYARGSFRAPIFYDTDTSYYLDPDSTSKVVHHIIGGHSGTAYNTASTGRLYFGTSADNSYSIYTHMEDYGGYYTKLTLDWHTGIKIGAANNYGGIRFYNNSINSSGSEVFSIAKGDNHVRINNNLYISGVLYDSDTSYYLDPNSSSFLNSVSVNVGNESTGAGNSSTSGLVFRGNYNSNSWAHKFHKYDNGGGVPLYLSYTHASASWSPLQGWGSGLGYTTHVFGNIAVDSAIYTPTYYRKDNTGYYLDPSSGGTALNIAGNIVQGNGGSDTGLAIYHGGGSNDYARIRFYQAGSNNQTIHIFPTTWQGGTFASTSTGSINLYGTNGVTFGTWNDLAAYIGNSGNFWTRLSIQAPVGTFTNDGSSRVLYLKGSGNIIQFQDADGTNRWENVGRNGTYYVYKGYGTGAGYKWQIDDSGNQSFNGIVTFNTDARAPIFYDTDTSYYVDPNSSSRLNSTYTTQSYTYGWFRNYGAQGLYNEDYGNHWYATGNDYWNLAGNNGSQVGIILRTGGHQGTIRGYVYADNSNNVGFLNSGGSWRARVVNGDYWLVEGSSARAPIFYDADTSYYVDPNSTSRLNYIDTNDGNLQLYKTQAVDMSNTSVYSTSNYYPVIISVPTSGCWIEIQNNLNTNVPSWSTHGSGFSLNLRWWTNGSGWGTTEVKRRVEQYHERFTNQTICGGISQLTHSSEEVVWLRGGGYYRFHFSRNLTAYPQSTSYTNAGLTASVTSTAVNTVWNSAAGAHTSYNTSVFADIFYDYNDTGYYCDPNNTNRLNFVNSNNHYIQPGYMLYSDFGGWTGEYNKIQWHSTSLYLQSAGGGNLLILRRGDGGERFWCDYNGNVTASGNITAYSDQRLKTNIETIANPLELVNKLRGVTFDWIETGKHSYGLIAQEVEQVIPELVLETTNGNTETDVSTTVKSVDYSKLVSVLIEAVKEQQQQIDKLTKLVETLLAK